ncbi:MAG: isoquinoline 1-oxidoreductase subunit beta [Alphaproteobacteria bacterium]|nr:isoquinoline 1-oxidoreductase subunit beta [Alphaproteobacteria bacterium]
MNDHSQINRRSFLASVAAAGGALALGFEIPFGAQAAHASPDGAAEVTAWVVIRRDDAVVVRIAKSEMGQGSFTALAMLVAEELECDWAKVTAEFADPHENLARNRVFGDMSTGGSRAIRSSHELLRKAGATAREMLVAAAAAAWQVPAAECRARKSVITHAPSGRTLSYGTVAEAAARIEPPREVTLKDPKDWTIAGKPTRRLEIIDKVQGKTVYGIDVRLPDMLHAALIQSPVFKGTLKAVDDSRLAGMKGVRQIVKLKDAVAVVAESWWQAKQAVEALGVTWDDGGNGKISSDTIKDFLRTGLDAAEAGAGRRDGNVADGLAKAARRIEAEYSVPFLGHATMEPQNCTAHVTGGRVEIWVSTQNGEAALAAAALAAGVPTRNVIVHKTMLGGGFGRRGAVQDFIPHAVLIAKEIGQPVKTIWTREEDMRHDYYRPVAMTRMVAGLDASGMPLAWHVRMTGNSIRGTLTPLAVANGLDTHFQEGFLDDMPYDVPNYLADYAMRNTHVPVGFWRCVNHSQNCFFKESFVDELAHAAGADPYDYRRRMLGRHKHAEKFIAVLDAAAKQAGWGKPLPPGVYRGIALEEAYGTYVAGVVEASLGDAGEARMHRIVVALDPGHMVNPMTVAMQAESSVVFALTAALYGEITIKDGRVEQSNFHDYPMLRIADMPKVETVLMPSGGFWGGCGEPVVAVVAPALCNAIFAASGKRVRSLPLKNHDLRKA